MKFYFGDNIFERQFWGVRIKDVFFGVCSITSESEIDSKVADCVSERCDCQDGNCGLSILDISEKINIPLGEVSRSVTRLKAIGLLD